MLPLFQRSDEEDIRIVSLTVWCENADSALTFNEACCCLVMNVPMQVSQLAIVERGVLEDRDREIDQIKGRKEGKKHLHHSGDSTSLPYLLVLGGAAVLPDRTGKTLAELRLGAVGFASAVCVGRSAPFDWPLLKLDLQSDESSPFGSLIN